MDHDLRSDIWCPAEPAPYFHSLVLKHRECGIHCQFGCMAQLNAKVSTILAT